MYSNIDGLAKTNVLSKKKSFACVSSLELTYTYHLYTQLISIIMLAILNLFLDVFIVAKFLIKN